MVVMDSVRCPYCGFEDEFKLLKTWKYSWWNVYLYECPKCGGRFRYQVDPEGKRKNFILRVRKGR
jgi:DNA-directed RNA polymerase subunit RPC12/RpoP